MFWSRPTMVSYCLLSSSHHPSASSSSLSDLPVDDLVLTRNIFVITETAGHACCRQVAEPYFLLLEEILKFHVSSWSIVKTKKTLPLLVLSNSDQRHPPLQLWVRKEKSESKEDILTSCISRFRKWICFPSLCVYILLIKIIMVSFNFHF